MVGRIAAGVGLMLGVSPAPARVWLVVELMDMRLGIDGLSSRIQ